MYVIMKSNITVSVDSNLLAEVRGVSENISKLVEDAFREKLNKGLSLEEKQLQKDEELMKLKVQVHQKSELYPDRFKKCVRYAKYCGIASNTIDEKIIFWGTILENMKKEIPPEPPKEKGVL